MQSSRYRRSPVPLRQRPPAARKQFSRRHKAPRVLDIRVPLFECSYPRPSSWSLTVKKKGGTWSPNCSPLPLSPFPLARRTFGITCVHINVGPTWTLTSEEVSRAQKKSATCGSKRKQWQIPMPAPQTMGCGRRGATFETCRACSL